MSYFIGLADNINVYATTTALAAADASTTLDGTLAQVTGSGAGLWKYVLNGTDAIGTYVLAATGGGQWQELFNNFGLTYIMVDDSTNNINNTNIGSITNADVAADAAIAISKLAAGSSAQIIVCNSGGVPVYVAVSSDATISNTGALTIANSAITTAKLNDGAVTLAKLAAGITPQSVCKFSAKVTWSGSGTTIAPTVAGVVAGDRVIATIQTKPTQAAYLVRATAGTDSITFELSAANTSNDAVIGYTVFRDVA